MNKPIAIWVDDDYEMFKTALDFALLKYDLTDKIQVKLFSNSDDAIPYILANQEYIFFYSQDSSRAESKIINSWKNRNPRIRKNHFFKTHIAGDFYHYVIDAFTPYASCNYCTALSLEEAILKDWCELDERMSYILKPLTYIDFGKPLVDALERWYRTNEKSTLSNDDKIILPISEELASVCGYDESFLDKLTSRQFEEVINSIFKNHGFNTELTAQTRDGGYDIKAISNSGLTNEVTLIEVKHFAKHRSVGVGIIRQLYGVKALNNADRAILVTSSFVTPTAKKEFKRVIPVELEFAEREKVFSWCQSYLNSIVE
ncbi:MAG: restriction endonuclease [Pedobacter sp.]|nr:restriction endonuclease [Pedobacter sp.]